MRRTVGIEASAQKRYGVIGCHRPRRARVALRSHARAFSPAHEEVGGTGVMAVADRNRTASAMTWPLVPVVRIVTEPNVPCLKWNLPSSTHPLPPLLRSFTVTVERLPSPSMMSIGTLVARLVARVQRV